MATATDSVNDATGSGRYALKENSQFLIADARGDIAASGEGLFRDDMRVLSRFCMDIGAASPSLLRSGVSHDNVLFRAHLTNRPLPELGGRLTPEGVIHIERGRFLWDDRLWERIVLTNYGGSRVPAPLRFRFAADFADIFEVRGLTRKRRGRLVDPEIGADYLRFLYEGLDGKQRSCVIGFSIPPDRLSADTAEFNLNLAEHEQRELYVTISPERGDVPAQPSFRAAAARARVAMRRKRRRGAFFESSGDPFRLWLGKARADLALLTDQLPTGPYPCAGIPWFSAPFGRDGLITALQTLWCDPALARGVLQFLAEHQAKSFTRRARARWRCSAKFRSAAITARWTARRSSYCSRRRTRGARPT